MTITVLASGNSGTDASSVETASFTPSANALLIAALDIWDIDSVPPNPSATSGGISWAVKGDTRYGTTAGGDQRLKVWAGITSGAPPSDTVLFSFGDTCTYYQWVVFEITDVDFTVGADGVVQTATVRLSSDPSPHTVSLSAPAANNNIVFGIFAKVTSADMTPSSGWTQLIQLDAAIVIHRTSDGTITTPSVTSGATSDLGAVAIEVEIFSANPVTQNMALATATAISGSAISAIKAALGTLSSTAAKLQMNASAASAGSVNQAMNKMLATALHHPNIVDSSILEIVFNTDAPKQYFYKIYDPDGNFLGMYPAVERPGYSWSINGGMQALTCFLPRKYGFAGEIGEPNSNNQLALGNIIETVVVDREASLGVVVHSGRIEEYEISDPPSESIPVSVVPFSTRATDRFLYGPLEFEEEDPTDMMRTVVEDYLPGITWSASNPSLGLKFTHSFLKQRIIDIIETIRRLAGSNWYWRIGADNVFTFSKYNLKSAGTHIITGHTFTTVNYVRSSMEKKQRVFVFGAESHDEFGFLVERIEGIATAVGYDPAIDPRDLFHTDSRITDNATADRIAHTLLEFHNQDSVETEVVIFDSNPDPDAGYDLEILKPGDTLEVFNPNQVYARTRWGLFNWGQEEWNNEFAGLVQGPLVIADIGYEGSTVRVKLTNKPAAVIEELVNTQDRLLLEGST